ncbi:MAG: HAD family hydrolase [Lachnospiraceae bacterium]|nr:HAD family hydrolase [Lachnospiraceae bacterium]
MYMIRTVIFDLDNTLYDCSGTDREVTQEEMAAYVRETFGWSAEEYLRRLDDATEELIGIAGCTGSCRNRVIRYQFMMEDAGFPIHPHVMKMYEIYWEGMLRRMKPYPEVKEVLERLRRSGIRIGVGTDLTAEIQYRKMETLGIIPSIDFLVTSEEASLEKPTEIFFDQCRKKMRCRAEECLFIGDRIDKDYEGAKQAGMQALWLNREGAEVPEGIEMIRDLTEIFPYIESKE